jgi:hypothetical protein
MVLTQGEKVIEVTGCKDCPFSHGKCRYDGDNQEECWVDENVRIGGHFKPLVNHAPCPLENGPVLVKKENP